MVYNDNNTEKKALESPPEFVLSQANILLASKVPINIQLLID